MACFGPLDAWQLDSGSIVFVERGQIRRALKLPCGRCIGCRQVRVRSWALRCMHEAKSHAASTFVTLTYDEEHYRPGLDHTDWQRFMYRVRERFGPTRFFMCGEYGDLNLRPHFHGLLFGLDFEDRSVIGSQLYRSASLERLWPYGFSTVGDVTFQSASYVARYSLKKVTGDLADVRYNRVDLRTGEVVQVAPEYGRMSLRPGLGDAWFRKYWREVYEARDGVCMPGGKVVPAPRYYMKLLDSIDPELVEEKQLERYWKSVSFAEDQTPQRLREREICAIATEKRRKERYL